MHTKPSRDAALAPPPHEVDRAAPTPRISGSFSAFRESALSVVKKIEERRALLLAQRPALASRRTAIARELLAQLDDLTARAEELAAEFDRWPERPPDVLERSGTIQRLVTLQEQVRTYLEGER